MNVEKVLGFPSSVNYRLYFITNFFSLHFSISLAILQHFTELHNEKCSLLERTVESQKSKAIHVFSD